MGRVKEEPYGAEALAAWTQAVELAKEGKYEEARNVKLYPTDYVALEKVIQREQAKRA